jgi:hypothetical protein
MTNDASRPSLGRLLVERGVLTQEQLEVALQVQRDEGGILGEIITSRGWVSPLMIAAAVAKQKAAEKDPASREAEAPRKANWKPLGTLLVEKGLITAVELKQALAVQSDGGGFLGEILVDNGWLTASDLVLGLAAQLGLDFDAKRAGNGPGNAAVVLPSDRPAAHFEVLESVAGEVQLLKTAQTFMEATDFVFDEVLWQREPGELQIVRVDGGHREVAWSIRPDEAQGKPRDDMLSVFGYPVGQWEDKHQHGPDDSSLAALG